MRCWCPYERVDFRQGYGIICCNYPCCPSDSLNEGLTLVTLRTKNNNNTGWIEISNGSLKTSKSPGNSQGMDIDGIISGYGGTRMIVSGYAPMNLPPLVVTCFSCILPFFPCMLLMNMNVWAWEFDLENDIENGGSALVMYERRKGICCEEKRVVVDYVTKVVAEEITDEQMYIQSRLSVKGINNQIYHAPLTDFVELSELETLANTVNNIIPPYFPKPVSRQGSQQREYQLAQQQQHGGSSSMQSYQPYQQHHNSSSNSGMLLHTLSPDRKHSLSHMLRLTPTHSISIVMPTMGDDESCYSDAVLLQLPDSPHTMKPGHRGSHFGTPDVLSDITKVMPLKEVIDLIRKKYDIGQNLAMAAVLTHANIQLGLQSTGSLREDAFRIAKRLDLIDTDT